MAFHLPSDLAHPPPQKNPKDNFFEFSFSPNLRIRGKSNAKGGEIMFFTILAYSITIFCIAAYLFFSIFPCDMIVGPRMGHKRKSDRHYTLARRGRKWEKKNLGIRDIMFWLE